MEKILCFANFERIKTFLPQFSDRSLMFESLGRTEKQLVLQRKLKELD